jgi:Fe2+ transport system protein FeoA
MLESDLKISYGCTVRDENYIVNTLDKNLIPSDDLTLADIKPGVTGRIMRLCATPEVNQRLREMGFCESKKVKMISRNSNIICKLGTVRFGVGRSLAQCICLELVKK